MIGKFSKIGTILLIVSTLIVILAMPARRLPLLTDFGPHNWLQYFIAMLGFLGVGAGLFISYLTSQDNSSSDNTFAIVMILGGLYVFVMGFILVLHPRWLDLSISGVGLAGVAVGFLYFFGFHKRYMFLQFKNQNIIKIPLLVWMAILLTCFLLYWGAPVEFWQILDRFGINVDKGGLLRNIQNFLNQFFTFPSGS